jgi:hypothetical protein
MPWNRLQPLVLPDTGRKVPKNIKRCFERGGRAHMFSISLNARDIAFIIESIKVDAFLWGFS